jgi:four helix bundle protein
MALITRFEDIRAWQEARKLTMQVYQLTSSNIFMKDFGLRNQIRRAAVSGMSNIAEGFDCKSKKEFSRFLGISRRSLVEVQSLLYVALDAGYIDANTFTTLYEQANTAKALVGGFMKSISRQLDFDSQAKV